MLVARACMVRIVAPPMRVICSVTMAGRTGFLAERLVARAGVRREEEGTGGVGDQKNNVVKSGFLWGNEFTLLL